jgi:hypothetical protein
MTYGAILQRTAEQGAQKPIPFLLRSEVDWSEKRSSHSADITLELSGSTFRLPWFAWASLITSPVYREMAEGWQESGLSLVHASELQFRLVEQLYILRRRAEVIGFIKAYPFLVPLLLEAYGKIAKYFGPSPNVVLEVVSDPEAANHRELFILVRTSLTPSEALTRLERFDQEWWLNASEKARCMLNVDVEYV